MSLYRTRPISSWPAATPRRGWGQYTSSPFRSTWTMTLDLLERELRQIDARDVVLEIDITERMIRNDGEVYANAHPSSPAVVLSCQSAKGPLRFPCDRFDNWQDNVRAIALALEALRKVDRYGVTSHDEQYRGWQSLPPAGGTTTSFTAETAARYIAALNDDENWDEEILADPDFARSLIREALKRTHPDRGGSAEDFHKVQAARAVLEAHHGGAR